mmetsp:Transcript_163892/g.520940  ORF Transcript_163892/g.520940 Transcript_163892/m.520940 type:complete len:241 (-) Transcript_163892:1615-2337(-)
MGCRFVRRLRGEPALQVLGGLGRLNQASLHLCPLLAERRALLTRLAEGEFSLFEALSRLLQLGGEALLLFAAAAESADCSGLLRLECLDLLCLLGLRLLQLGHALVSLAEALVGLAHALVRSLELNLAVIELPLRAEQLLLPLLQLPLAVFQFILQLCLPAAAAEDHRQGSGGDGDGGSGDGGGGEGVTSRLTLFGSWETCVPSSLAQLSCFSLKMWSVMTSHVPDVLILSKRRSAGASC